MNLYFIYTIILAYPIATEFSFGLRILDVILIGLVLFDALKSNKLTVKTTYLISILIVLSYNLFASQLTGAHATSEGFMLFAKLVVHALSFFIIKKMFEGFSDIELKRVFYLYTIVLLMVVTWCLISFAAEPLRRVGFPFSQTLVNDSHALGSLLSLSFLFLALNLKNIRKRRRLLMCFYIFLTFIASLITGSRSIFFLSIVCVILVSMRSLLLLNVKWLFVVSFITSLVLLLPLLRFAEIDLNDVRSIQFSLQNASEAKRLDRLINVMGELDQVYYAFGRGIITVDRLYFDGTLTFMLYNFGILGAIFFLAILARLGALYIFKGYPYILFATLAIASVLVSEFFLLARWYIPVVISYMLLYQSAERLRIKGS